jgi:hypothetical protein
MYFSAYFKLTSLNAIALATGDLMSGRHNAENFYTSYLSLLTPNLFSRELWRYT